MKKEASLHDLAVRLCEGGAVWFEGHSLKAVKVTGEEFPCYLCDLDSICNVRINDLCAECDRYSISKHYLKLAYSD